MQQLLGWAADNGIILAFDVALHVGTLAAVLIYFRVMFSIS
jgi:undecaprenyl pyrophosphate phosphatase UppP